MCTAFRTLEAYSPEARSNFGPMQRMDAAVKKMIPKLSEEETQAVIKSRANWQEKTRNVFEVSAFHNNGRVISKSQLSNEPYQNTMLSIQSGWRSYTGHCAGPQ